MEQNMNVAFVDKFYQMDPATEDVVFDASGLQDGMVVLCESYQRREDVTKDLSPASYEQAMRFNRWAKISHLNKDVYDNTTVFLATYEDGSKKKISIPSDYAWIYKKNSYPAGNSAVAGQRELPVVGKDTDLFGNPPRGDVLGRTSYSPLESRNRIPVPARASVALGDVHAAELGVSSISLTRDTSADTRIDEPPYFNQTRNDWERLNKNAPPIN